MLLENIIFQTFFLLNELMNKLKVKNLTFLYKYDTIYCGLFINIYNIM